MSQLLLQSHDGRTRRCRVPDLGAADVEEIGVALRRLRLCPIGPAGDVRPAIAGLLVLSAAHQPAVGKTDIMAGDCRIIVMVGQHHRRARVACQSQEGRVIEAFVPHLQRMA